MVNDFTFFKIRELTLFWSKLLKRLEPSEQAFLDRCRQMSLLSKTVYHILFLIKVIQSEVSKLLWYDQEQMLTTWQLEM